MTPGRLAAVITAVAVACACSPSGERPRPVDPPPAVTPADASVVDAAPTGIDSLRLRVADAGIELVTATTGDVVRESTGCRTPRIEVDGEVLHLGCRRCEVAMVDPDPNPDQLWGFGFALHETPRPVLAVAGLLRIVLCKRLVTGGDDEEEREVGGTIDGTAGEIWLTINTVVDQQWGWRAFHHELYHLLARARPDRAHDRAWAALNPEDFRYGGEARLRSGFVSQYATTNHQEDQAETYARMVGEGFEMCSHHDRDAVVIAKARLIRDRVAAEVGDAAYIEYLAPCAK